MYLGGSKDHPVGSNVVDSGPHILVDGMLHLNILAQLIAQQALKNKNVKKFLLKKKNFCIFFNDPRIYLGKARSLGTF